MVCEKLKASGARWQIGNNARHELQGGESVRFTSVSSRVIRKQKKTEDLKYDKRNGRNDYFEKKNKTFHFFCSFFIFLHAMLLNNRGRL